MKDLITFLKELRSSNGPVVVPCCGGGCGTAHTQHTHSEM